MYLRLFFFLFDWNRRDKKNIGSEAAEALDVKGAKTKRWQGEINGEAEKKLMFDIV